MSFEPAVPAPAHVNDEPAPAAQSLRDESPPIARKDDVKAALQRMDIKARLDSVMLPDLLRTVTITGSNRRIGFRTDRTRVFCEACHTYVTQYGASQGVWKHFGYTMRPGRDICPWLKLDWSIISTMKLPSARENTPIAQAFSVSGGPAIEAYPKRLLPTQPVGMEGAMAFEDGASLELSAAPLPTDTSASTHNNATVAALPAPKRARLDPYGAMALPAANHMLQAAQHDQAASDAVVAQQVDPQPLHNAAGRAVLTYDLTTPQGRVLALLRKTEEHVEHLARCNKQVTIHVNALQALQTETIYRMDQADQLLHELRSQVHAFIPGGATGTDDDALDARGDIYAGSHARDDASGDDDEDDDDDDEDDEGEEEEEDDDDDDDDDDVEDDTDHHGNELGNEPLHHGRHEHGNMGRISTRISEPGVPLAHPGYNVNGNPATRHPHRLGQGPVGASLNPHGLLMPSTAPPNRHQAPSARQLNQLGAARLQPGLSPATTTSRPLPNAVIPQIVSSAPSISGAVARPGATLVRPRTYAPPGAHVSASSTVPFDPDANSARSTLPDMSPRLRSVEIAPDNL
ncbi:uncharacterized protein MONBRDRAFT_28468 [Monosiga brevicollis MX1]|uniref:Uncharacterized protein n=1 Tax=Monosiga brevicollis TaxID=81824 RepID=A9V893_MONBE|nr:uncharacterized protein MONBRDRAFT_28468 [Monosiga brevicollis MX1]EDQ86298.1 predicted protein [Monosiga brevicollis MX1]|eukprot:XP_001748968.1 hypothetical protein [Monosiga brevicollis MX1]